MGNDEVAVPRVLQRSEWAHRLCDVPTMTAVWTTRVERLQWQHNRISELLRSPVKELEIGVLGERRVATGGGVEL